MTEMRLGDCVACDTGDPVPLFLDVQRGDAVNCCESCCAKWAADIIRGTDEPRAAPSNPSDRSPMPTPLKPGETPEEIADLHGHWSTALRKELAKHIRAYGDRRGEEERAKALAGRDAHVVELNQRLAAIGFKPGDLQAAQRGLSGDHLAPFTTTELELGLLDALVNMGGATAWVGDGSSCAVQILEHQLKLARSLAAAPSGDAPVEAIRDTTGEPEPRLRSLAADAIAQAYAKGRAEMAERAAQIADFDGAQGTANTIRSIAPSGDAKGTK